MGVHLFPGPLANHIDVIYAPPMRGCAKFGCEGPPVATVGVRYEDRLVLVGELGPESDPNLLDLCQAHLDRLTPPRGWEQVDVRRPAEPAAHRLPA